MNLSRIKNSNLPKAITHRTTINTSPEDSSDRSTQGESDYVSCQYCEARINKEDLDAHKVSKICKMLRKSSSFSSPNISGSIFGGLLSSTVPAKKKRGRPRKLPQVENLFRKPLSSSTFKFSKAFPLDTHNFKMKESHSGVSSFVRPKQGRPVKEFWMLPS